MKYYKKKLSIIIPVYNEKKTIEKLLKKINQLNDINKEIIVVNDASNDGTKIVLQKNKTLYSSLINHKKNLGKGAAIKSAQKKVKGDIVIIQDGDLEYDPRDYYKMLKLIDKNNKVIYGSRVLGKNRYLSKNFTSLIRIFFNHVLTIISNVLNNQNLTDAHTCYKMFLKDVFLDIKLKEDGFSFCPEVTTKIALKKIKIKEVPIRYRGRTYDEGKKINFTDGIEAILTLLKYRFFK